MNSCATCCSPQPSNQATGNPATLKGWVNTFYRHYKGRKLGPYHVRRWKVGRKIHREYIKPEDVERVKAACACHRETQKQRRDADRSCNTFINNWDFMGKMLDRWDKGKVVTPAMEQYILRLHREGMYITGRPPMRRRIEYQLAKVAGEKTIVKTVFELDGTTKVFMVPFLIKQMKTAAELWQEHIQMIDKIFAEMREEVHAKPDESTKNRWLHPAY